MATYVLGATAVYGHVVPLFTLALRLSERGHDVTLLTGARFAYLTEGTAVRHVALEPSADLDDRDQDTYIPDREKYTGLARAQYEIQSLFFSRLPGQYRSMTALIDELSPDAVLVDSAFSGVLPLLLGIREIRPVIVGIGVLPLAQSSSDVAPFGLGMQPSSSVLGRLRNRALALVVSRLFRDTQRFASGLLAELGSPAPTHSVMDLSVSFDRMYQLTVEGFEYPRRDLAPTTRFVGPLLPRLASAPALPDWWADLDAATTVVHVTQGTMDNHDFGRLILPTIEALESLDCLVVVSTGNESVERLGRLPANVRTAPFLPYAELLPQVDVMITNGGYGGVHSALTSGVPLVVAGDTEDKPEVTSRVTYAGVGINLKTGTPTAAAIRAAVETVLADASYRYRAGELAATIALTDAVGSIDTDLADLVKAGPVVRGRGSSRV